ncbi:MAG: endonuclease V [candidate division Zixibacteria bacterium]|nr:endonuclease V [candidate division Zixibacteria bacterium]
MRYKRFHGWPTSRLEAAAIQLKLAQKIDPQDYPVTPRLIAAVDTAYGRDGQVVYAAAVVTTFPEIEEVERTFCQTPVIFPYIPGMYYFREGACILEVLEKIRNEPDLLMIHGHGIAHPRNCGMACFIGLAFDKPSIGCARKLLVGRHREVAPHKGGQQPIIWRSREVGIAYRAKDRVKPIYISPGYKCNLQQARDIVVMNLRGFRLPEPLRLAYLFANKYKRYRERKTAETGESVA